MGRLQAQIQSGYFYDADELHKRAPDALDIEVAVITQLAPLARSYSL